MLFHVQDNEGWYKAKFNEIIQATSRQTNDLAMAKEEVSTFALVIHSKNNMIQKMHWPLSFCLYVTDEDILTSVAKLLIKEPEATIFQIRYLDLNEFYH